MRDTRVRGAKRCPLGSFLRRDPPSISEIHVSIGSTVSITQQPINGINNADTILGDARAELVKRDDHAGKCVGQLPSARLLLQKM